MFQGLFQPTTDKKIRGIIVLAFLVLYLCIFTLNVLNSVFYVFGLVFSLIFLIPTLVFLLIIWFISGKITLSPVIQGLLYLIPFIILTILPLFEPKGIPLPNHRTPLNSPSKHFNLQVKIEGNQLFDAKYWKIIITDKKGKILYKDNNSDFVGFFNVYWIWDKQDNVWLYNSDDGCVYYWTLKDKKWTKNKWNNESGDILKPPIDLYPSYHFKK